MLQQRKSMYGRSDNDPTRKPCVWRHDAAQTKGGKNNLISSCCPSYIDDNNRIEIVVDSRLSGNTCEYSKWRTWDSLQSFSGRMVVKDIFIWLWNAPPLQGKGSYISRTHCMFLEATKERSTASVDKVIIKHKISYLTKLVSQPTLSDS